MSTMSTDTPSSWPPASLDSVDVNNMLNLTEGMEATGSMDPITLQLQMAALLYMGDTVACRHLWRRHAENTDLRAQLQPWWNVGAAMHTTQGLWQALQELEASSSTSSNPIPVSQYAKDIAQSYRVRTLLPFVRKGHSPPAFLAPLLGFSTAAECQDFCQRTFAGMAAEGVAPKNVLSVQQQAALLAFLESQMVT